MADQFPYRNVNTGIVQSLTEEQAAVFPGQFDLLADDYAEKEAVAAQAAADLSVAQESGSKSDVKDAKAAADDAAAAAAAAVVTPAQPADDAPKES